MCSAGDSIKSQQGAVLLEPIPLLLIARLDLRDSLPEILAVIVDFKVDEFMHNDTIQIQWRTLPVCQLERVLLAEVPEMFSGRVCFGFRSWEALSET